MIKEVKLLIDSVEVFLTEIVKTFSDGSTKTLYRFNVTGTEIDFGTILYIKNDISGFYEPYIYNYKENENGTIEGTIIEEGSFIFEWILAVRNLCTKYSAQTQKYKYGSFDILQWLVSIETLKSLETGAGNTIQIEGSRQLIRAVYKDI